MYNHNNTHLCICASIIIKAISTIALARVRPNAVDTDMLAVISTVQATFIVVYENGYVIIKLLLDTEKVIFLLAYHHITSPFFA